MPIVSTGEFKPFTDVAGDICGDPSTLAYISVIADIAIKTGAIVYRAVADKPGPLVPITGHQCLRASEIQLDKALEILNDEVEGAAIQPGDYKISVRSHDVLREEWYELERRTDSIYGNWAEALTARSHYHSSSALVHNVKRLSKKGLVQLASNKAKRGHHQSTQAENSEDVEDEPSVD